MGKKVREQMLEEIADRVKYEGWWPHTCQRIAEGAKVTDICREYVINVSVFRQWVLADPSREDQYQDALETRANAKRKRPPRKKRMLG